MKYYVYTKAYPDGSVFYVGKGQGDRLYDHEREARSGKNVTNWHKVGVIRKIWAGGGEVLTEKVFETDDEQEALYMEMEYIAHYGRSNLTNLTDGGEGTSGYSPTDEVRAKLSEATRKRWDNRSEDEKIAALERRIDNWWRRLRDLEKYVMNKKEPPFDRISRTKLYPTYWEEPEGFREFEPENWGFSYL